MAVCIKTGSGELVVTFAEARRCIAILKAVRKLEKEKEYDTLKSQNLVKYLREKGISVTKVILWKLAFVRLLTPNYYTFHREGGSSIGQTWNVTKKKDSIANFIHKYNIEYRKAKAKLSEKEPEESWSEDDGNGSVQ